MADNPYVEPVQVSKEVYDGIKAVEKIGIDMHNPGQVKDIASQTGHTETSKWINDHVAEYMRGVLEDGFKTKE